jgi:hypothetical protein
MSKFNKQQLINALSVLGQKLSAPDDALTDVIDSEHHYNAWFTPLSVMQSVVAIGRMLNIDDLRTWVDHYSTNPKSVKKVGLILAGNIPMVGFHDVLCVIASGHHALIKSSSQDARLIKYILDLLTDIEPQLSGQFEFIDRLKDFDAVIATGSNNTSRYFEYYFGKVPHVIRKNRNSVALLTGQESTAELHALGHDIFDYYGLGCRNVSKLLVPRNYNFTLFFEAIEPYQPIIHHHKYNNNYDYNKSIYLVNREHHLDNGFLLVKEDGRLSSPLAVLYFEYYDDLASAQQQVSDQQDNIQCVVSTAEVGNVNQVVGFGQSQQPKLWDYADGIDTMHFLSNL